MEGQISDKAQVHVQGVDRPCGLYAVCWAYLSCKPTNRAPSSFLSQLLLPFFHSFPSHS